jgi:hypothetical protein
MFITKIIITNNPPGKVADVELHFTEGPLEGLKLIGFGVWTKRGEQGGHNVTFPARQYNINGERRSFALLRPINDKSTNDIRDRIVHDYTAYVAEHYDADGNLKDTSATEQAAL